jgi:hypothetical protein
MWRRDRDLNPRTAINGCRFSRPVLSTTQPSLHKLLLKSVLLNNAASSLCLQMPLNAIIKPGDVLLSHGEAPHYHRRYFVSLLSSEWNQVGPKRYGRQAKF